MGNTYHKYAPNVFLAKCKEKHNKGDIIIVETKYGKENEHIVFNQIGNKNGFFYYSIIRADGMNCQKWANKKSEKYKKCSENAEKKSDLYFEKSNKDSDFLSLGEPIKVGHHSEKRHRKLFEDANKNMSKCVEFSQKADEYDGKADYWEKRAEDINLSIPESIDYFKNKLEKAIEYHQGLKSGKYEKSHSYSLTYAKKEVNNMQKNYDLAVKLWGENL